MSIDCLRPISLCNTSYKILSKIMATRMKKIMGKLISDTQGEFVLGRQILDHIIIVQEAILSKHGTQAVRYGYKARYG